MTTGLQELTIIGQDKYGLKVTAPIKKFCYKPVYISNEEFSKCVEDNYENFDEMVHITQSMLRGNHFFLHASGAAIGVDPELGVIITGTEKAIQDAQSSLELMTQLRLEAFALK